MVTITKLAKKELEFWLQYLPVDNGFPISAPIASGAVSFSDASGVGLAAVITPYPDKQEIVVHKEFNEQEKARSSTFRELMAVLHGLRCTKHLLRNQAIRWDTDAKNLIPIIRKGSMIPDLLEMALEVFEITKEYNICLSMSWLKRSLNQQADSYSRIIDYDDWGVHPNWFRHISKVLGRTDVDRFADANNRKLPLFNSRFYCLHSIGTDAFTQNWEGVENWLVPPIYLIGRTLSYLSLTKSRGILVVPMWRSAYFWPIITQLLENKPWCLRGSLVLGDIFKQYKNKESIFGSGNWRSKTWVLSMDMDAGE